MARVPTIRGCVQIQRRLGTGQAQPCHLLLGQVTTYHCENGSYTVTYSAELEWILNGEGECSSPTITSSATPGFDYGAVLSTEESDPSLVSDGDALTQAEGCVLMPEDGDGNPIWESYAATIFEGKSEIFGAAHDNTDSTIATASKSVASANASYHRAEIRFRLKLPMACNVIIQRGHKLPDPEYPDPPSEWVWESEESIILTSADPEYLATCEPGDVDVTMAIRLRRYQFIPYA